MLPPYFSVIRLSLGKCTQHVLGRSVISFPQGKEQNQEIFIIHCDKTFKSAPEISAGCGHLFDSLIIIILQFALHVSRYHMLWLF